MPRRNQPEETAVSVAGRIEPQINRYYYKISKKYMVTGILFMLLLVLYLICVMAFFGEYVTYENLKYLVRDFSAVSVPGSGDFSKIVYNGSDSMTFTLFRGGVSACDGDSYLYYDTGGINLISDDMNYADAVLVPSEKYLLAYDLGGTGYSIYNQLTRIVEREADGRIMSGDIGDDGSCILVTRSRETRYVVDVFNAAFNKTMSIYKENYVLDAAVSPDGTYVIIVSAVPDATDFNCEIEICMKGRSEPLTVLTYEHTMPLDVFAYEDGFLALCDNGIYAFDYSGMSRGGASFTGMQLKYADDGGDGVVCVGQVNALGTENRLIAVSSSGEVTFETVLEKRVNGVYAAPSSSGAAAYIRTPDSVIRVDENGEFEEHKPQISDILTVLPTDDGAIVCGKSAAYTAFDD
ncbi:MAG: hypothetical protein IJ037_08315 [Clostridia bacterium]|nr:hypothetical protein [Clostridia bacterium]